MEQEEAMTIRNACISAVAGFAAMAAGTALAQEWDMPTPYPEGNFHTQNIIAFADDVREATGGALDITVHPAGSLIGHAEIKNAVRSGQAPVGEFLLSRLANENPVFAVDTVPFLATSYDDAQRLWAASQEQTEELLARQNLTVLFTVPWPPQGLYADQPIETIGDLAGMRFRAYNAGTEQFAQLAGAVPTQVEVPDIPQAFATGRVDAMITSSSTGVNTSAWDYLTHFYDAQAWLPKNIVVVNTEALESLDEETRSAVLAAAEAAQTRGWEASQAEHQAQMDVLAENGIAVGPPSDALAQSMREIGATMAGDWEEDAGEAGAAILDAYNQ
jgi:TRAP-type C4-dicarboxylate transport system substrate-binding protein